jgi:hypothetical protein
MEPCNLKLVRFQNTAVPSAGFPAFCAADLGFATNVPAHTMSVGKSFGFACRDCQSDAADHQSMQDLQAILSMKYLVESHVTLTCRSTRLHLDKFVHRLCCVLCCQHTSAARTPEQ